MEVSIWAFYALKMRLKIVFTTSLERFTRIGNKNRVITYNFIALPRSVTMQLDHCGNNIDASTLAESTQPTCFDNRAVI